MTGPPDGRAKRRVLRRAVLLLAVGAVLALIFWPAPKCATYEGKAAEEWLRLCDPTRTMEDDPAWNALVRMGTDALPDLERILGRRPNSLRDYWKGWMIHLHLARPDPLPVHEWNYRAARAAYILAERGNVDIRPLLPVLTFHFTNSTYGEFSRALASAGDEGISVLTNYVLSDQLRLRNEAASALRFVRNKPQAIAALLRVATFETNRSWQANALLYLQGSGAPAAEVVPLALQFLRSEDAYTRWAAAELLVDYRSITEVRNTLKGALNDPDEHVRKAAARARRP